MNQNLSLSSLKIPKLSADQLRKWLPYIVSVILVGLFLYTALLVKSATTVQAADAPDAPAHAVKPIDKQALNLVNNLIAVPVQPDLSNLGTSDPFGN